MAYVANGIQDEEQDKQVTPGAGGSSVHLAPSAGVGAVGNGAGTSNNGQQAGGGSFATINQYLSANQDQAQPLAGKITQGITNQYNTLSGQNDQTVAGLNSAVNSGYTKQDSGLLAQEAADPTSFAADDKNVQGFQGQLNDKYTGPQSAETNADFMKQQAALNSTIQQGKASTQSEAGRQGLLQNVEKTPTNGVTSLNSAILSQDPNAQSQIEHAYDPFSGLVSGLSASGQQIDQNIAGATKEAQNASQTANSQLQGQVTNLNQNIGTATKAIQDQFNGYNAQAQQAQGAATTANSAIQGYLSNTPQVGNVDTSALNPYLNIQQLTGAAPTAATSASSQDYATQAALQKLAGANPLQTAITQDTASQAGTALPGNFAQLQAQLAGMPAATNSVLGNVAGGLSTASQPALNAAKNVSDLKTLENSPQAKKEAALVKADQDVISKAGRTGMNRNQLDAARKKLATDQATYAKDFPAGQNDTMAQKQQDASNIGAGQWVNGADAGFNSLLSQLGGSMAPIGVNTLPTEAQVTPDTSSAGFGGSLMQTIGQGIANPLLLVPKEINAAKKEAAKI